MPGRTFLFLALLAAAVAGPFLLSRDGARSLFSSSPTSDDDRDQASLELADPPETAHSSKPASTATSLWQKWFGSSSDSGQDKPGGWDTATRDVTKLDSLPGRPVESRSLGGPPGLSLADVLRFDVHPSWITQHWSRVTTLLTELELHGVRVPLVTGTEPHDVTGSLTYYFDKHQVARRIQFKGYTGDPELLKALVQQRFGMRQYASVSAGLFLSYQGQKPIGYLRIEQPLVQEAERGTRYQIELEVNAPGDQATLSAATLRTLHRLRKANML